MLLACENLPHPVRDDSTHGVATQSVSAVVLKLFMEHEWSGRAPSLPPNPRRARLVERRICDRGAGAFCRSEGDKAPSCVYPTAERGCDDNCNIQNMSKSLTQHQCANFFMGPPLPCPFLFHEL